MRLAPRFSGLWALLLSCALSAGAQARPSSGEGALALIQGEEKAGRLDGESALLECFRLVFAPARVAERFVPTAATPVKCLTPLVAQFEATKSTLSAAAVAEIEGYLAPKTGGLRATYISPGGKFSFTYTVGGTHGVSATDVNPANGIPDFVERCAEYCDNSWLQAITTLGFMAPALPGDGTYDISFQNMPGTYGFTAPVGATTEIVLENNFTGFPPNDDPDGDQLGAAKVTIAHEFKHASQYTNNGWSEGNWVELDATWMEDIVYDATNDYYNYINPLPAESQLAKPWIALDGPTPYDGGLYEDCLWQHYLSEKHGNQFIVDVYARRRTNPGEGMKTTYQNILGVYGSTWDLAYPEFMDWCWFTGNRNEAGFGFGEAATYRRMELRDLAVSTYPFVDSDLVDQLAGHPRRFNPGTPTLSPRVQFDGADTITNFTVSILVKETGGAYSITHPAMGAGNVVDYTVPLPWSSIAYVGVLVTNSKRSGGEVAYSLTVSEVSSLVGAAVPGLAAVNRLEVLPNTPNPFAGLTTIRFAVPAATRGNLKIVDVAGRVVRTLVDGNIAAGRSEMKWDATNQAGKRVPAGVYWARLETSEGSAARKVLVIQ